MKRTAKTTAPAGVPAWLAQEIEQAKAESPAEAFDLIHGGADPEADAPDLTAEDAAEIIKAFRRKGNRPAA